MLSMPDGTLTRGDVSQARELLAASPFLFVDVELPDEDDAPDQPPLAHLLGLEAADVPWLGRRDESPRAEIRGDGGVFVVPAVDGDRVVHVQVLVTERYLLTVHRGPAPLIGDVTARFPLEAPSDSVAMLFLLLDEAMETYRRAAVQALLEVEDLEDAMFRRREPEQLYRLSRLRRTAAMLHHTLLPYHRVAEESVTRRVLNRGFREDRGQLVREYRRTGNLVLADIESLQESARRAFGSYSSLVSGEQNGVINRLAVVSTIFLPLTFVTGFFGMNFLYLTDELESRAVFWLLAVGLQVAFLVVALYVLHRTRLWRRLREDDSDVDDD
ncbi:CorA family divalent cation transporter [Streptomyces sp. NPDC001717]|uniref:magnesium transporter CorA family protein n=1 Tax=Streptomyces sp. NPDC001717 TaxID=3364604 RepID=UPI00367DA102